MENERVSSILPKLWDSKESVGEHSIDVEAATVTRCGVYGKANVGISNDNAGEKPAHRKTKVS